MSEASVELLEQATRASLDRRFAEAGDLLRRAFAEDPTLAGGHRGYLADILNRGADLQNVAALAPYRLNTLVHCGWLNSLITARPVDARGLPIPWFTYPAIDFLEPKVRPEWNVLEWGSGNSTLWWSTRVRQVTSIEHHRDWHRVISARAPGNARVVLAEDPEEYANARNDGQSFDAIVIDGEDRNRCARRAVEIAGPDAVIIFDNSDRKGVRDGLAFLASAGWKRLDFFGLLPAYLYRTCTSIFYRNDAFLAAGPLPCDIESSLGLTCAQVLGE